MRRRKQDEKEASKGRQREHKPWRKNKRKKTKMKAREELQEKGRYRTINRKEQGKRERGKEITVTKSSDVGKTV